MAEHLYGVIVDLTETPEDRYTEVLNRILTRMYGDLAFRPSVDQHGPHSYLFTFATSATAVGRHAALADVQTFLREEGFTAEARSF